MFNKRNETRNQTTKQYSINLQTPKLTNETTNPVLNFNISTENEPLPVFNTYRSASKTTTVKDIDHKKYGIRPRKDYTSPLLSIDSNKYSTSKVVVKKDPNIIPGYQSTYKYDSKTAVNTNKYNINNNSKNSTFISGSSQSNYISTNIDGNKYQRKYTIDKKKDDSGINSDIKHQRKYTIDNKSDDSNLIINSNKKYLINKTNLTTPTLTTKMTSLPNNRFRNNTASHSNKAIKIFDNNSTFNSNDRKNEPIKYKVNTFQKLSNLLEDNPLFNNNKSHTIVVTRNPNKLDNDRFNYNNLNINLNNIGTHNIVATKKKEKPNIVLEPRKNEVISSTNKYTFSLTDKNKENDGIGRKNNFLDEIKNININKYGINNKKNEDEIKAGYNSDDQRRKNMFKYESKYIKISNDDINNDNTEKPKNLKKAIERKSSQNYEYVPKDIKISNVSNVPKSSKFIEYKPKNINILLNETKSYKSEPDNLKNEEKPKKNYEYKPKHINLLNESKNKPYEYDSKNILDSIEKKIKNIYENKPKINIDFKSKYLNNSNDINSISTKNYESEPKNISKKTLDYNPPLINRSEINNNYVYDSKYTKKPKEDSNKKYENKNNYIYNITKINKTTPEEIKKTDDRKSESINISSQIKSILNNNENEPKIKLNYDFKPNYLNRFNEKKILNEPKSTKVSTEQNIKNNYDFKSKYLSEINNVKSNEEEPKTSKTSNITTIFDYKTKNNNQTNELNKIKNYVMLPKNINILGEKKNKNIYENKPTNLNNF